MRFSRGGALAAGGAFLLAVAMFLPWNSLSFGDVEGKALTAMNRPIPANGSAWASLGISSIVVLGLVVLGVAVAWYAEDLRSSSLPLLTSAYGFLVSALIVEKLFVHRLGANTAAPPIPFVTSGKETAIGAGGYLGLIAALAIAIGALTLVLARSQVSGPRKDTEVGVGSASPGAPSTGAGRGASSTRTAPWAEPQLSPIDAGPLDRLRTLSRAELIRVGMAIALIVTVYMATRLLIIGRLPYFVDEGIYATWIAKGAASTHQLFISETLARGPLQPWFAIGWVKLGFNPLVAGRLVSVTSGLLTVGVVGLLGRHLGGAAVGWVAAALCVVLPFFFVQDGVGIYEPLVTLIMASALYLQLVLARRPSLRLGVMLGLVLGAGILTKQNTLPALALIPVSLLCFDFLPSGRRRRLATWVGAITIAGGMFIAADLVLRTSSYYAQQQACHKNPFCWPAQTVTQVLDNPFALSGQAWAIYRPALIGYITWPMILVGLIGAVSAWRVRPRLTAVFLTWAIVPFLIALLFERATEPRHVMYLMPPVIVMIAYGLVRVATWAARALTKRVTALGCTAGAVLLLTPALIFDGRVLADPATAPYPGIDYWQYVTGWPSGFLWQDAAKIIRKRATGRQVVVLTAGSFTILKLLFWHDRRYVFASGRSPLAARAQFVLTGGDAKTGLSDVFGRDRQALQAQRQFVLVRTISRPKGSCAGQSPCGGTMSVYERSSDVSG